MLLLDTHVWWWSLTEPERLSATVIKTIKQTKPYQRAIASISIWEFAMMAVKKRIELKISASKWLFRAIHDTGLRVIELSPEIAVESCSLPGDFHKDPADRIIVATARVHNLSLLTKDRKILDYPNVKAVW
ncbi:MAG: type II toxin-antitoxin system VapC family toxin [Deltaproteobacteria bacterium]|nr:type II toxin-antitoxin system VapC family toxin [Deltaproteobacteria bacterium]